MPHGLLELGVIVLAATGLGILARIFKQPTVLAYLVAGVLLASMGFTDLADREAFRLLSDLGIMFLLFLVGLEINYSSLRLVGKAALVLGIGQVAFTGIIGFGLVRILGYGNISAAYIAAALTFSSTVIIVKLLSDKKDLHSLYGKISIGMLLVQDVIAILALVFLTGVGAGSELGPMGITFILVKAGVLFAAMIFLGRNLLPYLFDRIAHSHELLFLTSLAWMFLISILVSWLGFSIEIAGFLAGLALANSAEHYQIASRIRPLRDFFILLFFVILGVSASSFGFEGLTVSVLILSLFVLLGNPLIVFTLMGLMGYRRRTTFFTGVTVAQISEFSLILAVLGLKLGHLSENSVALVTAVGFVTIALSTYMILHSESLFRKFSSALRVFERKMPRDDSSGESVYDKPIILIGCHRTGESMLGALPKEKVLVLDFDPDVTRRLRAVGVDYLFGDISDEEVFERANVKGAKIVISTSPDYEDNRSLLREILKLGSRRPKVIVRAETDREAKVLYAEGADYVLFPHITSGHYLGRLVAGDSSFKFLADLRSRDESLLRISLSAEGMGKT